MTAAPEQTPPTAGPTSGAAVSRTPGDPGERGRLTIDPVVLCKIAEHMADLAPGTVPTPRTMAGVRLGRAGATAKAIVIGQQVDLRVGLALRYPDPVRPTVDHLRSRISQEVRRITGYEVRSIAVTVTALLR